MSDNVQLIKEEIERRMNNLWYLIPEGEKVLKDDFTKDDANNLGKYTALENLLHFIDSIPEEPTSEDRINECLNWDKDWGCSTSPMNNCDTCPHAKWVEVKEKKKNYNERYKKIAQTEQFKKSYCDKSLGKEKYASDDLEEEIDRYYSDWQFDDDTIYEDMRNICRHFTKWQKQQMMKDAVDATILDIDAQTIEFGLWPEKLLDIKEGDKVKIIILK